MGVVDGVGSGQREETAEATDDGVSAGALGAADGALDLVDELVASVDGDTGLGVSERGVGGLAERAVGNVLAVEHVLKADGLDALVTLSNGFLKGWGGGRGGNHTASRGLQLVARQSCASVENEGSSRRGCQSDGLALRVSVGVAASNSNDGGGEVGLDLDRDTVQPVVSTSHHDLGKIGVLAEQGQQSLGLWVSTADVVFKDLRSVLGHHETGEQDTNEGET